MHQFKSSPANQCLIENTEASDGQTPITSLDETIGKKSTMLHTAV